MRILLVSHPPLVEELGAAQTALRLAAELRALGHDAVAWSPEPLPPGTSWWNLWVRQRRAIERHVAGHGPFDAIETPAVSATSALARAGRLIVRSIQPELLYLRHAILADLRHAPFPRAVARSMAALPRASAILAGWRRAETILCLGSRERDWMHRHFPAWAAKTGLYVCAPSSEEQSAFAEVRRRRPALPPGPGLRFLWIGRWTSHKGTRRLLGFLAERLPACPDDTATVAGCGPAAEREVPAAWVRTGRVRLVPSFTRAELPALLAEHDAGLFTSSLEGWGQSLNEMLEAGLTVFATPAGAVNDLRPYFPASLRPFPPPQRIEPEEREDLAANGYYERFTWSAIARDYARQALAGDLA